VANLGVPLPLTLPWGTFTLGYLYLGVPLPLQWGTFTFTLGYLYLGVPFWQALALLANIILALALTNSLAYLSIASVMQETGFTTLIPRLAVGPGEAGLAVAGVVVDAVNAGSLWSIL